MLAIFICSVALRFLTTVWSVFVARRQRDWRVLSLTAVVLTMTVRQAGAFYTARPEETFLRGWEVIPAFGVSVMMVTMVGLLSRMLDQRRAADRQIQSSELRYRSMVELSPQGIIIQRDGVLTYANPAAGRLWGAVSPQQLLYRPVLELIHPDTRDMVRRRIRTMLKTGQEVPLVEQKLVRLDGSVAYAEVTAAPFVDSSGPAIQVLLRDITAHRTAEEALRETMARLDITVASANIGLWTLDVRSGNVYFSPAWKAQLGYRDDEVANDVEEWRKRLHPEDRERVLSYLENYIQDGSQDYVTEFRLQHRDGSYRWIYARGSFYPEADGSRRRLMGCHVDLTERKAVELELRESELRFQTMARASPVGLFRTDARGGCTYVNERWCKITGLTPEQAMGEGWARAVHDDDRAAIVRHWHGATASGQPVNIEFRFRRPDGTVTWVIGQSAVETLPDGRVNGFVGSITDINDRKREDRRRRLMMNELDHRVKNNLAGVLSLAQQTLSSCGTLEEFRPAFTGRIQAMAQSHALLARSRWEGLDLTEAARLILGPFLHDSHQHNRIRLEGPPLMLPARAALPVSLAIHELATNAIKHGSLSSVDGAVALSWAREGEDTLLHWAETGGPPVTAPTPPITPGMGIRLIRGLIVYELRGQVELDFRPAGLLCTIRIPGDLANQDDPPLEIAEV